MTALPAVDALLATMTERLAELLPAEERDDVLMVGIHTGGAWVAEHLHRALGLTIPLGTLDISFYRDDFSRKGMHPEVRPSHLPAPVEDRTVVLVDDVLFSGRTIRAALNELFDYGRPAAVRLAVLVDRDGRELPIAPDVTGAHVPLAGSERIKLRGPAPLTLTLSQRES